MCRLLSNSAALKVTALSGCPVNKIPATHLPAPGFMERTILWTQSINEVPVRSSKAQKLTIAFEVKNTLLFETIPVFKALRRHVITLCLHNLCH
jgi:hypothetical protein